MRKFTRVISLLVIAASAIAVVSCSPAAKKARHLAKANDYFAAGQYDNAEVEYINVLRLDADNQDAYSHLGTMFFDEGRYGKAYQCLQKMKQLQPDNIDVHIKLGMLDLAAGKIKDARDEAMFVLAKNPQDREAPGMLADTCLTLPQLEAARQLLQKLPVPSGGSAPVTLALGALAFRQGDLKAAETAYKQALAIDPKSGAAYAALAQLAWAQNDLKTADEDFKNSTADAPLRSGRRLQYARFKIQTGDLAAGKAILSEILKTAPDYLPASTGLADIVLREKNYDECATLLDGILMREPGFYDAMILKGNLSMAKGDSAKAVATFETIVANSPKLATANYQLAMAYLANHEPTKAIASLNQTLALNPGNIDAITVLALLKFKAGEIDASIALLEPLLKVRPPNTQALHLLADAYRGKGEFEAAIQLYSQLLEADPKNPNFPLSIGLVQIQQHKPDDARQSFEKALELAPDSMVALEQLTNLDLTEKKFAAAQQRLEKAIEKYPQSPEAQYLIGRVFLAEQDQKKSAAALQKAIELRPNYDPAYTLLTREYLSLNQRQQALDNVQLEISRDPTNPAPLMLLGMIQSGATNYPAARDAYEKLLTINPHYSAALNNLAYLYAENLGELDKAYDLAKRAREELPQDPLTADTLGWILFRKGQYAQAIDFLQQSAAQLPNESEVLYHLGMTQYRLGQEDAARQTLARSLQSTTEFKGKDQIAPSLAMLAINPQTASAADRTMLEKHVTEHPDDPVAVDRLMRIDEHDGKVDQAIALAPTAIQANPTNARLLIDLARLYATRPQDLQKAIETAKLAYKLAPDDLGLATMLGRLAFQTGDFKWALSLLQAAAQTQPGDAAVQFDLAKAFYSMGQVDAAAASARGALQLTSPFPQADAAKQFLDMIALAAHPADALAAADRIDKILAADPNNVPALFASATITEQKNDASQAQAIDEKIVGLYPDFVPAQKQLAILYAASGGDNQKAYDLAMKAREMYPDDAALSKALGIIVYRRGDYSRAADLLQASLGQVKDDALATYYLGMAQFQLKKKDQSRQNLQHALELKLSPELTAEAQRVLVELK